MAPLFGGMIKCMKDQILKEYGAKQHRQSYVGVSLCVGGQCAPLTIPWSMHPVSSEYENLFFDINWSYNQSLVDHQKADLYFSAQQQARRFSLSIIQIQTRAYQHAWPMKQQVAVESIGSFHFGQCEEQKASALG